VPASVPAPHLVPSTGGVTVRLHDLGGEGPDVLLCHPTGFHAMVWAPVAEALRDVAHCWAPDLRGHGDTPPPADGDMDWRGVRDDVLAVVDHLGIAGGLAAGHSMGGAALVMAEQLRPGTFSRLWLYEPIVFPRPEGGRTGPNHLAEGARRRRARFASRDAAYDNYASKPPLNGLTPEALRAYVDHGFRDVPGEDAVELKCRPEVEGATFEAGLGAGAFEGLGGVGAEVVVAAGGDSGGPAQMAPLIAGALPHGRLERHETLTHFGPVEDPPAIAAAIRSALALG
jgi:pimeloyl-ACP methyl ester carboxylesterase